MFNRAAPLSDLILIPSSGATLFKWICVREICSLRLLNLRRLTGGEKLPFFSLPGTTKTKHRTKDYKKGAQSVSRDSFIMKRLRQTPVILCVHITEDNTDRVHVVSPCSGVSFGLFCACKEIVNRVLPALSATTRAK